MSKGNSVLGFILGAMIPLASCQKQPASSGAALPPSPNKMRLLNYLEAQYGKGIIAGQMDCSWSDDPNMNMVRRVFDDTGKYPALQGFDFLNFRYPGWGGGGSKQIDEAIAWWQNGPIPGVHGIVAFCWHWRVPRTGYTRADNDVFYTNTGDHKTDGTAFRIPYKDGALDKTSPAWALLQEDMDLAAAELAKLKALDIPVLWRPLHEAVGNWGKFSGGDAWFWWGASGPEPYKALYTYMYDYFTSVKQLNNLIWVWNGQDAKWFPDERTVELVGNDLYPPAHDYGSQIVKFRETEAMVPNKNRLVALTENGVIPDPDNLIKDGAKWSFFMTWNDSAPAGTSNGNFWSGDQYNEAAHKQKVYHHPYVITLDKLPDFTKD